MGVLKGTWAVALLLLSATCVHSQDIIQAVSPDGQVSFDRLVTEDFGCDITSSKAEYSYVSVQLDPSQPYFRAPVYPSACFPTKTPGPGQAKTILAPFSGWTTVYLNSALDYPTVNLANLYKQAKPAFVSVQTIDNSRGGSPLTQSLTYTKTTTNTFQWSLTESLQLGAKFGFKAGVPGFGEGSTEYSITGTIGSSQQWSSTNTETFASAASVTVQPGKCSVVIGATQYVSQVAIPFIFRNSVICTYQPSAGPLYAQIPLFLWNPYVNTQTTSNYTCSDVNSQTRLAGILGNSGFTGKLFPPTDGSSVSKTTNTGTFQVNFGVTATVTGCDCDDAACYEKATGISATSTTTLQSTQEGGEDPTDPIYGDPFGPCLDCLTSTNGTTSLAAPAAAPSNEEGSGTTPAPAPTATPSKNQGIGEQIAKKIENITQAKTAQVKISDLGADTVELMLRYCYGCLQRMPPDHCQVIELFKAADKYDVLGLVQECVARFRQLTGAAEVAPLLQVAAERHSHELRSVCIDITASCLPDVLATESFKELTATQPELVLDFVRETSIRLGCPSHGPAQKEPPPCAPAPEQPGQSSGATRSSLMEQLCGQNQHAQAPPTPPRNQPSAMHPQQQQQTVALQAAEQALQVDIPRRTNTMSTSGEDSE